MMPVHNIYQRYSDCIGIWQSAYVKWYDHDRAGHKVRAGIWGWIADRIVRFA